MKLSETAAGAKVTQGGARADKGVPFSQAEVSSPRVKEPRVERGQPTTPLSTSAKASNRPTVPQSKPSPKPPKPSVRDRINKVRSNVAEVRSNVAEAIRDNLNKAKDALAEKYEQARLEQQQANAEARAAQARKAAREAGPGSRALTRPGLQDALRRQQTKTLMSESLANTEMTGKPTEV